MKPLTIEELKKLQVGDWVWFVLTEEGQKEASNRRRDISHMYLIVYSVSEKGMELGAIMYSSFDYLFKDYGKTWLAYKNKEQEEAKGEIVELPEPFIDTDKNAYGETTYLVYRSKVDIYCPSEDIYTDKLKAERRLAELKGEV